MPASLQPSRRRTPSDHLVADSPDCSESSVDSWADSHGRGEISLTFLRDQFWSEENDIVLFEELVDARKQEGDYIGLSWEDNKMWELIHSRLKSKLPGLGDLDQVMDRIQDYKDNFGYLKDDLLCRNNTRLVSLLKKAFQIPVNLPPATVPLFQSRDNGDTTLDAPEGKLARNTLKALYYPENKPRFISLEDYYVGGMYLSEGEVHCWMFNQLRTDEERAEFIKVLPR